MNKYILLGVFLVSLAVFGAYAEAVELDGDFSAAAYQEETVSLRYAVCNDKSSHEVYVVKASPENTDWIDVDIGQEEKLLSPGKCDEDIFVFLTPKRHAPAGHHEIFLETEGGELGFEVIDFTVLQGHSLNLRVEPKEFAASQCEEKSFDVMVENTGRWDEKVEVGVEGIPSGWFELDSSSFTLGKGKTRGQELSVRIPCDEEITSREITVKASIPLAGVSEEENVYFNVFNDQVIGISVDESFQACEDETTKKRVAIENTGRLSDEIELRVEGPDWVKLSRESLALSPGEKETIGLILEANSAEKKNYSAAIVVESVKFGTSYKKELSIDLVDCYDVKVGETDFPSDSCLEASPEFTARIRNDGTQGIELKLSLAGIEGRLSDEKLTVPGNSYKDISFSLDLQGLEEGVHKFSLLLDAEQLSAEKRLELELFDCFDVGIEMNDFELCKGISTEDKFRVTNHGTQAQEFSLAAVPEWVELSAATVFLEAGEAKEMRLLARTPSKTTQGSYTITVESEENEVFKTKGISYESDEVCFGIQLNDLQDSVDVNVDTGAIGTLKLENAGKAGQSIEISVDEVSWVLFDPKQVTLAPGEEQEVYVYFFAPIDFPEEMITVTVKAVSEYGFEARKDVDIRVLGGVPGLRIDETDLEIEGIEVEEVNETGEKDVILSITLTNDTNFTSKILDINVLGFYAEHEIGETVLKKQESTRARMRIRVGPEFGAGETIEIPVVISTNQGVYGKKLSIALPEDEGEGGPTGFALISGPKDAAILVLLVILVLLAANLWEKRRKEKKKHEEEEISSAPSLSAEELKKEVSKKPAKKRRSRKAKPKSKSSKKRK